MTIAQTPSLKGVVTVDDGQSNTFLGFTRARAIFFLLFAGFVAISPLFLYPIFLMKVYCFIIFACAYNLLLGYTGLMSFGHAAFFGMGAYLCGYAATQWGLPFELSVLTGTVFAGGLGLVFGWIAIRRTGLYFAMITLALAQMVYFIAMQAPFTGGENGIQSIPRGTVLGVLDLSSNTALYWFMAAVVLAMLAFYNRIIHSPFGQVLRAIRNNPERTKSLGYNVDRFKLAAFTISAAMAGFAASLKTVVFGIATLTDVSTVISTEVVLINLVGGIGTIFGPVVGSYIILSLEHFLSPYGPWVLLIQGIVFTLFVLLFRQGVVGELQKKLRTHL
ncbi:branched-chain amino acid ABC transporter permease [Mesorhizobium australicum]|uniref:Amino acid/amide ABC transporter membrane protein 2, HAAT family n=1 Tax=Mesorhizobium australicum TaxID=536018 RepID=A0A1X7PRA9_9HYPH|nr:branched-chain amino acid ABC transporter permease [Mesorhizobium australicum]SMH54581.1 amino acid/amide ABC transporter membrane protein 2, HAAT family [Mesorhizobium australicum]